MGLYTHGVGVGARDPCRPSNPAHACTPHAWLTKVDVSVSEYDETIKGLGNKKIHAFK